MQADEAIILAGGRGTRLQPLVSDVPKPLALVAGRPFLAWLLDRLARGGMRRVVLATGYMSDAIERAIGRRWQSMDVDYSVEAGALGTGGAVRLARGKLRGGCAHVLNGDTFLEYSPQSLAREVVASGASIGIALARVDDVSRYGAVQCEGAMVSRFCEKGGSGPGYINAGCYFMSQDALAALPEDAAFSLEAGVLEPMAASGQVLGHTATRRFIDIGVPDDYLRAQSLFGTST
jgi:D-glycero-alpha-D-manno-heptose 1-phosphate guanylyltransferase